MKPQQSKMAEALLASFGVPSVSEVFNGPSKIVVDGVVPVKEVPCYAGTALPSGLRCACPMCDPDAYDAFNFESEDEDS